MLKEYIKNLGEEQKLLKKARKTGSYKVIQNEWGDGWNWDAIPKAVKDGWVAASKVQDNKLRITAALNLYHELRHSSYRHNYSKNEKCRYGKLIVEINNMIALQSK